MNDHFLNQESELAKKNKEWWKAYRARVKEEKAAQENMARPLFASLGNDS